MKEGCLSEYFEGAVAKRLSVVETRRDKSNQHEFNGVMALKQLLGEDRLNDCPTRFIWLGDENEGLSEDSFVTWYDSRENHVTRSEHRLYFKSNTVMELASENDLLIVAKRPNGKLMIIIIPHGSTVENQLLWLFGIPLHVGSGFEYRDFENGQDTQVDFATRFILEELGLEIKEPEAAKLDTLLERYQGYFPTTKEFSASARQSMPEIIPDDDPDLALLEWMNQEEKLFRRLERHIVTDRLKIGFWSDDGADVDGFISFSLGVHNRRKSRAGYAFEHHLAAIFNARGIRHSRTAITENKAKPDFLFPGKEEYHDENFPSACLSMLGVKSTCKDRWRQVLSEAGRIQDKHLITLEPGISENQTNEMQAQRLQLVVPKGLQKTYRGSQLEWLMSLEDFIGMVTERQVIHAQKFLVF